MAAAIQQLLPGLPEATAVGVDFLRRETRAEARMFRRWGADVLSYNLVPEVALARELRMCYAGLVTISGYAADRSQPEPTGEVRASLSTTVQMLPLFVELVTHVRRCDCGCITRLWWLPYRFIGAGRVQHSGQSENSPNGKEVMVKPPYMDSHLT